MSSLRAGARGGDSRPDRGGGPAPARRGPTPPGSRNFDPFVTRSIGAFSPTCHAPRPLDHGRRLERAPEGSTRNSAHLRGTPQPGDGEARDFDWTGTLASRALVRRAVSVAPATAAAAAPAASAGPAATTTAGPAAAIAAATATARPGRGCGGRGTGVRAGGRRRRCHVGRASGHRVDELARRGAGRPRGREGSVGRTPECRDHEAAPDAVRDVGTEPGAGGVVVRQSVPDVGDEVGRPAEERRADLDRKSVV